MYQLFRLKEAVASYITPVKRQRTGSHASPDSTPKELYVPYAASASQCVTPTSFFARFSRKPLSPPNTVPKNPRKRVREDDDEDGRGGSGMGDSVLATGDSVSSGPELSEDNTTSLGDDDKAGAEAELSNAAEIAAKAKDQAEIDRQALFTLRQAAIEDARAAGNCHEDELFLFERLSMLCFEPILPAEWQIDFPTLPLILFTEKENLMFINSNQLSASRAVKALRSLLDLGFRVKEKIELGKSADPTIVREIHNYLTWAEMDGGYSKLRYIPILSVVSASPHENSAAITTNLSKQMEFLAQRHREHLALPPGSLDKNGVPQLYRRTPPLIYGVIVAQANVFFFTLDSAKPGARTRHQTYYDMAEKDKEVWNGFAIAILVTMVRDYMMSIKDELEVDETTESDPDA